MNEVHFQAISEKLRAQSDCVSGQMFGKACIKTAAKKAFAAFHQEAMIFKLGQQEVEANLRKYTNAKKWDPSGKNRPMKDWLQLPADYREDWLHLAQEAHEFVQSQS